MCAGRLLLGYAGTANRVHDSELRPCEFGEDVGSNVVDSANPSLD